MAVEKLFHNSESIYSAFLNVCKIQINLAIIFTRGNAV